MFKEKQNEMLDQASLVKSNLSPVIFIYQFNTWKTQNYLHKLQTASNERD